VRPHFWQEPQRHRDSGTGSRGLRTRDSQATTNHHKPPLFSVASTLPPPPHFPFSMCREMARIHYSILTRHVMRDFSEDGFFTTNAEHQ
jgi:hypothetical protein